MTVNLFEVELQEDEDEPPGYGARYARIGSLVGSEQLVLSVYELAPGLSICPYHYENAEEEWLIVLVGRPTLRTPESERELEPWDCAFFPTGDAGAHKVTNRTDEPCACACGRTGSPSRCRPRSAPRASAAAPPPRARTGCTPRVHPPSKHRTPRLPAALAGTTAPARPTPQPPSPMLDSCGEA